MMEHKAGFINQLISSEFSVTVTTYCRRFGQLNFCKVGAESSPYQIGKQHGHNM